MSKPPWLPFIPFLKKHKKHTTFVYTKSCFMRPTRKIDWFQPQKTHILSPQLLRASPPFLKVGVPPFNQSPQPQVLPNAHRIHHRLSTSRWDRPWPLLSDGPSQARVISGVGETWLSTMGNWYEILKLKHLQNSYDGKNMLQFIYLLWLFVITVPQVPKNTRGTFSPPLWPIRRTLVTPRYPQREGDL